MPQLALTDTTILSAYGTSDPDVALCRIADDVIDLRDLGGHSWDSIGRITGLSAQDIESIYRTFENSPEHYDA